MRLILCVIFCVAVSVAAPAQAAFAGNRAAWVSLGADGQGFYAMGLFDGLLVASAADPNDMAAANGYNSCFIAEKVSGMDLAGMINTAYAADVANWPKPALMVGIIQMRRLCLTYVNIERAKRGLKAWTP